MYVPNTGALYSITEQSGRQAANSTTKNSPPTKPHGNAAQHATPAAPAPTTPVPPSHVAEAPSDSRPDPHKPEVSVSGNTQPAVAAGLLLAARIAASWIAARIAAAGHQQAIAAGSAASGGPTGGGRVSPDVQHRTDRRLGE